MKRLMGCRHWAYNCVVTCTTMVEFTPLWYVHFVSKFLCEEDIVVSPLIYKNRKCLFSRVAWSCRNYDTDVHFLHIFTFFPCGLVVMLAVISDILQMSV